MAACNATMYEVLAVWPNLDFKNVLSDNKYVRTIHSMVAAWMTPESALLLVANQTPLVGHDLLAVAKFGQC